MNNYIYLSEILGWSIAWVAALSSGISQFYPLNEGYDEIVHQQLHEYNDQLDQVMTLAFLAVCMCVFFTRYTSNGVKAAYFSRDKAKALVDCCTNKDGIDTSDGVNADNFSCDKAEGVALESVSSSTQESSSNNPGVELQEVLAESFSNFIVNFLKERRFDNLPDLIEIFFGKLNSAMQKFQITFDDSAARQSNESSSFQVTFDDQKEMLQKLMEEFGYESLSSVKIMQTVPDIGNISPNTSSFYAFSQRMIGQEPTELVFVNTAGKTPIVEKVISEEKVALLVRNNIEELENLPVTRAYILSQPDKKKLPTAIHYVEIQERLQINHVFSGLSTSASEDFKSSLKASFKGLMEVNRARITQEKLQPILEFIKGENNNLGMISENTLDIIGSLNETIECIVVEDLNELGVFPEKGSGTNIEHLLVLLKDSCSPIAFYYVCKEKKFNMTELEFKADCSLETLTIDLYPRVRNHDYLDVMELNRHQLKKIFHHVVHSLPTHSTIRRLIDKLPLNSINHRYQDIPALTMEQLTTISGLTYHSPQLWHELAKKLNSNSESGFMSTAIYYLAGFGEAGIAAFANYLSFYKFSTQVATGAAALSSVCALFMFVVLRHDSALLAQKNQKQTHLWKAALIATLGVLSVASSDQVTLSAARNLLEQATDNASLIKAAAYLFNTITLGAMMGSKFVGYLPYVKGYYSPPAKQSALDLFTSVENPKGCVENTANNMVSIARFTTLITKLLTNMISTWNAVIGLTEKIHSQPARFAIAGALSVALGYCQLVINRAVMSNSQGSLSREEQIINIIFAVVIEKLEKLKVEHSGFEDLNVDSLINDIRERVAIKRKPQVKGTDDTLPTHIRADAFVGTHSDDADQNTSTQSSINSDEDKPSSFLNCWGLFGGDNSPRLPLYARDQNSYGSLPHNAQSR